MRKNLVDIGVPYENQSSDSGVQNFQTLFHDQEEGQGIIIPPRSVLRMRVGQEEVPFCIIKFESKSRRHDFIASRAPGILAQPGMEKFLRDLVILRSINLAGFM